MSRSARIPLLERAAQVIASDIQKYETQLQQLSDVDSSPQGKLFTDLIRRRREMLANIRMELALAYREGLRPPV